MLLADHSHPSGARSLRLPSAEVESWPNGLDVRGCRANDGNELFGLFTQPRYRMFGTLMDQFESSSAVAAWIEGNRSGAFQIVGVLESVVIAFAALFLLQGSQSHTGWIALGVDEKSEGRGIGRSLLRVLLATADRLAGLRRIQLHVLVDNERAITLYRDLGFRVEGRHDSFARRDDQYVDALTMARINPRSQ